MSGSSHAPKLARCQSGDRARQSNDLPAGEFTFAVAFKYVQRISAARCQRQIQVPAAGKVSGRQKVRPYRDIERLGVGKKWRRKIAPGNGQERGLALGSTSVQI